MKVIPFGEAVQVASRYGHVHILLGNGFSRACKNNIFAYGALFDRADFAALSDEARQVFDALGVRDFEIVMNGLNIASALTPVYRPADGQLPKEMQRDAEGLKSVLVRAITGSHPDRPGDIEATRYIACRRFLANFERIYTLNYDLLLYWALMQKELGGDVRCDDGFRTPISGAEPYVTWEIENSNSQNIYYLHGALHIFDAGSELQKYTWANTGVPLTEQIRIALDEGMYPLFVAEGTSDEKKKRIKHSDYLSRAFRSFAAIGGALFTHGVSFGDSDAHILELIGRGKTSAVFVGIYGDPQSDENQQFLDTVNRLPSRRSRRSPLDVFFYSAESAAPWG